MTSQAAILFARLETAVLSPPAFLSSVSPTSLLLLAGVTATYLLVEVVFYIVFRLHLVPRANQQTPPPPYRGDYAKQRHLLLLRILERMERTSRHRQQQQQPSRDNHVIRQDIQNFLLQWFQPVTIAGEAERAERRRVSTAEEAEAVKKGLDFSRNNSSSSSSSSECPPSTASDTSSLSDVDVEEEGGLDRATVQVLEAETRKSQSTDTIKTSTTTGPEGEQDNDTTDDTCWTVPGLDKTVMDEFFSWAFFGKHRADLLEWEALELDTCFVEIERRQRLVFYKNDPAITPNAAQHQQSQQQEVTKLEPRRLSLEDVHPIHRPLLVYVALWFVKIVAAALLLCKGYRRVVASSGLVAWHRPALPKHTTSPPNPLLFFHGIAPAGLVFYLPMVFSLVRDGRASLLFENPNISSCMTFRALSEQETVHGVTELVDRCLMSPNHGQQQQQQLTLVGHSFGSCPLTWLLHSPSFRPRIRQLVLMDPVTLLLSEPDVMNNFLYSHCMSKIRMVAASELFTEYYLRRHFSWYNSELWLDDLYPTPEQHDATSGTTTTSSSNNNLPIQLLVALSARDEIVCSPKVKLELDLFAQLHAHAQPHVRLLWWDEAGHANCVTSPQKWKQLTTAMTTMTMKEEQAVQEASEEVIQWHPIETKKKQ